MSDLFNLSGYPVTSEDIASLKNEIYNIKLDISRLETKVTDTKTSFFNVLPVLMMLPCYAVMILFIIRLFRH